MENDKIQLFEDRKIRTAWDEEQEEWFFSVADVVAVLTDSVDPKQYIKKMRSRDPELNSKWGTICTPVQMIAADGKKRKIQAATFEENQKIARRGGRVAGIARQTLEAETGKPVITSKNAVGFAKLIDEVVKEVEQPKEDGENNGNDTK